MSASAIIFKTFDGIYLLNLNSKRRALEQSLSRSSQCCSSTWTFISIDQEKAFDSVDWEFLDKVLLTMNFGLKFRSIVKCCYNNIQSAILFNGYPSQFFNVECGVCQGCPLSPLLFVLVVEVFGQQGLRLPGGKEVKHIWHFQSY